MVCQVHGRDRPSVRWRFSRFGEEVVQVVQIIPADVVKVTPQEQHIVRILLRR